MMLTISVLLCAMLALSGSAEVVSPRFKHCPSPLDWHRYGNRLFHFVNTPVTWVQAEHHCQNMGANLASVHSLGEEAFLQDLIKRTTGSSTVAWIGGNGATETSAWFWADGSRFAFDHWNEGEPNNSGDEKCIAMNWADEHHWNDLNCGTQHCFVCAIKPCNPI
ncbi:ladderlectin-like [Lampris incognitus]|uniref:ladderlectin-like n=1 Tax=Lampris incognitus TaxID=2546036 RepID=UPI0024B4B19F|nr:ladderlectin-like [Lampris incognitus]